MGRQVRFYMLPEEERTFLDFVFQREHVRALYGVSKSQDFIILREDVEKTLKLPQIFFWDSLIGQFSQTIRKGAYKNYDETAGEYIDTGEFFYTFDRSNSRVIEYNRPFIRSDGKLVEGRIWAEMYCFRGDQSFRKEPAFISWYSELERRLKKNLKRDAQLSSYVSKRALEWRIDGGIFL
jgi:hypothetical protein